MHRVVERELLESAAPDEALRSLADLVEINRWLGGHWVIQRAFASLVRRDEAFSVLDFGSASGDAGKVMRSRYPNARVISADINETHLRATPPPRVVADAFRPPFAARSVDFVLCAMLVHHFDDVQIVGLLRGLLKLCRRALVVVDLQRHAIPKAVLSLMKPVFGWTDLTVYDGRVSVNAGFQSGELKQLAQAAGGVRVKENYHLPWFRYSVIAEPAVNGGRSSSQMGE